MRFIAAALIAILLCHIEVHASGANPDTSVVGQVTITNVDSGDSSKKLNGAHIKIVDKDTNDEYTDIIKDNGTLVYALPLGSYTLTQVLAPNDYQLNSKAYEFTLQVPDGVDTSNIKVVNASVMLTNDLIAAETETINTPAVNPAGGASANKAENTQPLKEGGAAVNQTPVEGFISAADKNPVTEDTSNMLLAIAAFSIIIVIGGVLSRKYLVNK